MTVSRLGASLTRVPSPDPEVAHFGFVLRVAGERAERATGPAVDYLRLSLEAEVARALAGGTLLARTHAAGVSAGGAVPLQAFTAFGGPVTGPGYGFHALRGQVGVAQRLEWQRRVPFGRLDLGRFGRVPSTIVIAPYGHAAVVREPGGAWVGYPSVGLGFTGFFDLFRLDVARTLRGNRWLFSVDVAREFWRVL